MMEGKTQKTHWDGCYRRHFDCCLSKCDEQEEIIISLKIRIAELEAAIQEHHDEARRRSGSRQVECGMYGDEWDRALWSRVGVDPDTDAAVAAKEG